MIVRHLLAAACSAAGALGGLATLCWRVDPLGAQGADVRVAEGGGWGDLEAVLLRSDVQVPFRVESGRLPW
jgi:hypothetical protein